MRFKIPTERPTLMTILVDKRENLPYQFNGYGVQVEAATLGTGDYSLPGFEDRVSIERKSLDDLIGCLTVGRDRFERELARSRPYDFFAVVVEASLADVYQGRYTSKMNQQSALQSIVAFEVRYKTPFVWAGNRQGGEYMIHSYLSKYLIAMVDRAKMIPGWMITRRQEARRDAV